MICNKHLIDIWFAYCKLHAFIRLYTLIKKKKFNLRALFFTFITIIFSIPFRLLKLSYFFIFVNKKSFRDGLEDLYLNCYFNVKKWKIEVLNRRLYLNCFTMGKLIKSLKWADPSVSDSRLLRIINDLQIAVHDFKTRERSAEMLKLELTSARIGKETAYTNHFARLEKGKSGFLTIHATSNKPSVLHKNQKIESAMPSLIKEKAKNPVSIVTENITRIDVAHLNYKKVSEFEVDAVKYQYERNAILLQYPSFFYLSPDKIGYQIYKSQVLNNVFIGINWRDFYIKNQLLDDISIGNYNYVLYEINEREILDILAEIKSVL